MYCRTISSDHLRRSFAYMKWKLRKKNYEAKFCMQYMQITGQLRKYTSFSKPELTPSNLNLLMPHSFSLMQNRPKENHYVNFTDKLSSGIWTLESISSISMKSLIFCVLFLSRTSIQYFYKITTQFNLLSANYAKVLC